MRIFFRLANFGFDQSSLQNSDSDVIDPRAFRFSYRLSGFESHVDSGFEPTLSRGESFSLRVSFQTTLMISKFSTKLITGASQTELQSFLPTCTRGVGHVYYEEFYFSGFQVMSRFSPVFNHPKVFVIKPMCTFSDGFTVLTFCYFSGTLKVSFSCEKRLIHYSYLNANNLHLTNFVCCTDL